jgi:prefoldin subunit 5
MKSIIEAAGLHNDNFKEFLQEEIDRIEEELNILEEEVASIEHEARQLNKDLDMKIRLLKALVINVAPRVNN